MKILWIKAGGLVPPDTGGKIRSYHLLQQLAKKHAVSVFLFYTEEPNDRHHELKAHFEQLICCPIRVPPKQSLRGLLEFARTIIKGQPYSVMRYCRPEVKQRLKAVLQSSGYDLIVCDFLVPAALLDWHSPPLKVLFTHNVESQIWARHYKVATSPGWKIASFLEYQMLRRFEPHYLRLADHVLAVSPQDKEYFKRWIPPEKVSVIPTGVDTEYFYPQPELEEPDQLVFTGSMDWLPNEEGILWFVKEVLPMIRLQRPQTELWVVGRKPSKRILELAARTERIHVTGWVEDVRPYLWRGAVYVVPLWSGSGTRLKIFEAMAAGKAVVSTTIGAEGLPVSHGEDILLADEPAVFAESVLKLLCSRQMRRSLGEKARYKVVSHYSWEAVAGYLESVLASVVEQKQAVIPSA